MRLFDEKNLDVSALESLGIYMLRDIGRKIGVKLPTTLKKAELIRQIKAIHSGEQEPYTQQTKKGRPPKTIESIDSLVEGYFEKKEESTEFNDYSTFEFIGVCEDDYKENSYITAYGDDVILKGIFDVVKDGGVIVDILNRLNFKTQVSGDNIAVTVPLYREDMESYPDIAEEIIREYGYDHIEPSLLKTSAITNGGLNDEQKKELHLKNILKTQGFMEAYNYSFYSPKDLDLMKLPEDAAERNVVKILNPISEDLSIMRTFLAPSMLQNAVRNIRRGNDEGREFEIANVYLPKNTSASEQPEERTHLVLGIWGAKCDFFDMKGAIEVLGELFHIQFKYERAEKSYLHPGVSANVLVGKEIVGQIGELDPAIALSLGLDKKVYLGELDLAALKDLLNDTIAYKNLPKFPAVQRDLALIADEKLTCGEIEDVLMHSCKYVTKAVLFDVYRGGQLPEGKKSMAFTLTFTPDMTAEKAFTPEVLDGFVKKILGNLKFKLGVELR